MEFTPLNKKVSFLAQTEVPNTPPKILFRVFQFFGNATSLAEISNDLRFELFHIHQSDLVKSKAKTIEVQHA